MKDFLALAQAVNLIEENLYQDCSRQDIARQCAVSLSKLEKLFRCALRVSIKEYVVKRRMTQAARLLSAGRSVTETAMRLGYNSTEVFCRAFSSVWQVSPSQFARKWRFTGLFPKLVVTPSEGERNMQHRRIDLTDAYEFFQQQQGTCVVCFDIQNLGKINEISHKAGDAAILTALSRMEAQTGAEMLLMRIGGDEFALFTCSKDEGQARGIAEAVLAHNGEPFAFEDRSIPLSLWASITALPVGKLHCADLSDDWQRTIESSKA
jgi:AraC family transcriptional regulator